MTKVKEKYELEYIRERKKALHDQFKRSIANDPSILIPDHTTNCSCCNAEKTSKKEALPKGDANYVHLIAKSDNLTFTYKQPKSVITKNQVSTLELEHQCTYSYMSGKCSNGHNYVKMVHCGKEWCKICGQKNSDIHVRRITRWQPKVNSLHSLGYLVITFPYEVREHFQNQKNLSDYRKQLVKLFNRNGFDKGLARWHWYGDCKSCKGKGCNHCNNTGIDPSCKWHPHLNILLESAFIKKNDQSILNKIRLFSHKYFRSKKIYLQNKLVLHYQYTSNPKKKNHILRYVTRATLVYTKVPKHIQVVKGFRNSTIWGAKKFEIKGEINELNAVLSCTCPKCIRETGEVAKLHWQPPKHIVNLKNDFELIENMGAGIYYANPKDPPEIKTNYDKKEKRKKIKQLILYEMPKLLP